MTGVENTEVVCGVNLHQDLPFVFFFFLSNSKLVRDRSALKKLSFFSFGGGGGGIKEAFLHTHFEAEHSRLNIKPN